MSAPLPLRRKIAFGALTTLVVLGLIEAAVRLIDPVPPESFSLDARDTETQVADEQLFWRNKPGVDIEVDELGSRFGWQVNAQGFRAAGPTQLLKAEGVRRIICVGDSVTFGYRVDREHTYAFRMQEGLGGKGQAVEVVNAGVVGYSSYQARHYVGSLLAYEPDVIVTYLGINDCNPAAVEDRHRARWLTATGAAEGLATYRLMRRLIHGGGSFALPSQRCYFEDFLYNLDAIGAACEARGVTLVLVMPLVLHEGKLAYAFPATRDGGSDADLRERYWALAKRHVSVDLMPAFAPHESEAHETLFVPEEPFRCHFNPFGHQLVADQLIAALK